MPIRDTIDYPISYHFQESIDFIETARNQAHNVLVHCHAGVSRSATIVCVYLMMLNNWTHQ